MQIHELTKRRKERTDEGLLDSFKAGINAAKQVGTAAYNAAKPAVAAAKAVGQAATSPTFGAVASNQGALDAAEKARQEINKKYGLNIQGAKRGAGEMYAGQAQTQAQAQAQTQAVTQQAQKVTQQFTQTPEFDDLSAILPDPGHVLVLKNTANVKYYKDETGKWFVKPDQGNPVPLTPDRIKWAEQQIDKDQYGQEASPTATQQQAPVAGKPTAPATAKPGLKEAVGFNRAALAKASKKADAMLNNAPLVKKLKTNITQISADPAVKQAVAKAKTDLAKASATTYSTDRSAKAKKQKVAAAFQKYAQTALQGLTKVSQSQAGVDANAGNNTQQSIRANQQEKVIAAQTISKATGQDGNKIVQAAEKDPQVKQALATITKESFNKKLKTALRKSLREDDEPDFGGLDDEPEDIIVTTAKGDYVKSGADGKWRDPKGTVIDPNKYADYVAKLEARATQQSTIDKDNSDQSSMTLSQLNKLFNNSPASKIWNNYSQDDKEYILKQFIHSGQYTFNSLEQKMLEPDPENNSTEDEDIAVSKKNKEWCPAVEYNGKTYRYTAALPGEQYQIGHQPTWYEWTPNWLNDDYKKINPELSNKLTLMVQQNPSLKAVAQVQDRLFQHYADWVKHMEELEANRAASQARVDAFVKQRSNDPTWYANQQNDAHNQQVQDTFNQLQNAKIYKTGQEDYLKDRLAALMAMRESSVNNNLDKKLQEALNLLNEAQVKITKDIIVRTAGGNYVKKASDQTWYDPHGVAIDPEKYADYIKKLDGTPQAQTQYQADANKGMTTSFLGTDKGFQAKQAADQAAAQSAPIKATPALIKQATQNPDPVQQIADQDRLQAILRARNVEALNSLTQDTFNQLQNAKIFKTGQEDYLNDRLKALMAMKA